MDAKDIERILTRLGGLKKDRDPWVSTWRDLADYFLPRKAQQFSGGSQARAGDEKIFDSTPCHCLDVLASRLGGLLTNANMQWFGLRLKADRKSLTDDTEVKAYLAESLETLQGLFSSDASGFQAAAHELYLDLALFGVAVLYVESDPRSVVRFSARPLSEIYVAESPQGVVDTVFREFEMPAHAVQSEWREACSQTVRDLATKDPHKPVKILHAVYPRLDRDPAGSGNANFPWASVFLEVESKTALEESGYLEMPFMAPRWSKAVGETYGRGPGLTALSDVRVLNAMARTALLAAEKMSDPPLMVPDDGYLGQIHAGPGGLSYYRAGSTDRIEALPVAVDLKATEYMMEQRRSSIKQIFMVDQFDAPDAPAKTAYQVMIEDSRKMGHLAPVMGRLQAEYLGLMIRRVFAVAMRGGAIKRPPRGLTIDDLEIHYTSPVAQAQRQDSARAITQALEILKPLVGEGDPLGIMDNFDTDRITATVTEAVGVPPDNMRAQRDVDAIREARAKAAQTKAALDAADQAVRAAATAAGASTGEDKNLLQDLLGGA